MVRDVLKAGFVVLMCFASLAVAESVDTSTSLLAKHDYEMVKVHPGEFTMGSPDSEVGRGQDENLHAITITKAFEIGASEVTMRLFEEVMDDRPVDERLRFRPIPVNDVTWYEAIAFCNKLSESEGLELAYSIEGDVVTWDSNSEGYRLPTEAEWEYAARAGESWLYAGSDRIQDVGWYEENASENIQGVSQLRPNAFGLFDMSGNVWEWCWDSYGEYEIGGVVDPVGSHVNQYRVARGGSFATNVPMKLRVADRDRFFAGTRYNDLGFRIARNVDKSR